MTWTASSPPASSRTASATSAFGYNEGLQWRAVRSGSHDVVVRSGHIYASQADARPGTPIQSPGPYATVTGGAANAAHGVAAAVLGGSGNSAIGVASIVSGGSLNRALGDYSVILGGSEVSANEEFQLANVDLQNSRAEGRPVRSFAEQPPADRRRDPGHDHRPQAVG